MRSTRGSFFAELLKLRKRPAMWILAGVLLLMGVVFGYLIPYLIYLSGDTREIAGVPAELILNEVLPGRIVSNVIGGYPLFGGAIAVIIGALVASSEYGWGTLKTILIQRPRRVDVLAGKFLVLAVLTLTLTLASLALAGLSSWTIASAEGRALSYPGLADLLQGIGSGWLILGMWSLFGVTLGILFRSTSLAIGLGLVWSLVVESLISGFANLLDFLAAVQKWLPGVNAGSLAASIGAAPQDQATGTPGVVAAATGPQAVAVLVAYVAGMALLSIVLLRRQDIA